MPVTAVPRSTLVDLSHTVEHGLETYRGLPGPIICNFLTREGSPRDLRARNRVSHRPHRHGRQHRHVRRLRPFHRFADGRRPLAQLAARIAGAPRDAVVVAPHGRSRAGYRDPRRFEGVNVRGHAPCSSAPAGTAHWRTDAYFEGHPFLTRGRRRVARRRGRRRARRHRHPQHRRHGRLVAGPVAHRRCYGAGDPIGEHLRSPPCRLAGRLLRGAGQSPRGFGTFPSARSPRCDQVRAGADVPPHPAAHAGHGGVARGLPRRRDTSGPRALYRPRAAGSCSPTAGSGPASGPPRSSVHPDSLEASWLAEAAPGPPRRDLRAARVIDRQELRRARWDGACGSVPGGLWGGFGSAVDVAQGDRPDVRLPPGSLRVGSSAAPSARGSSRLTGPEQFVARAARLAGLAEQEAKPGSNMPPRGQSAAGQESLVPVPPVVHPRLVPSLAIGIPGGPSCGLRALPPPARPPAVPSTWRTADDRTPRSPPNASLHVPGTSYPVAGHVTSA